MQYHLHCIGPVSYTHLDVYKRQPLYGLFCGHDGSGTELLEITPDLKHTL